MGLFTAPWGSSRVRERRVQQPGGRTRPARTRKGASLGCLRGSAREHQALRASASVLVQRSSPTGPLTTALQTLTFTSSLPECRMATTVLAWTASGWHVTLNNYRSETEKKFERWWRELISVVSPPSSHLKGCSPLAPLAQGLTHNWLKERAEGASRRAEPYACVLPLAHTLPRRSRSQRQRSSNDAASDRRAQRDCAGRAAASPGSRCPWLWSLLLSRAVARHWRGPTAHACRGRGCTRRGGIELSSRCVGLG